MARVVRSASLPVAIYRGASVCWNSGDTGAAGFGGDEKVVEDQDRGEGDRREAGVELGEGYGAEVSEGEEDGGVPVGEAGFEEGAGGGGVRGLAVELAVGVEEGDEEIEVFGGGGANLRGH